MYAADINILPRERREHRVFEALLLMVPGLEQRLMDGNEEDVVEVAEMVCLQCHASASLCLLFLELQKGVSSSRSDDTKSLKGPILDWIAPQGQSLNPPLARNVKTDCGFHHERTGSLLCPTGLDWSDREYVLHLSPDSLTLT